MSRKFALHAKRWCTVFGVNQRTKLSHFGINSRTFIFYVFRLFYATWNVIAWQYLWTNEMIGHDSENMKTQKKNKRQREKDRNELNKWFYSASMESFGNMKVIIVETNYNNCSNTWKSRYNNWPLNYFLPTSFAPDNEPVFFCSFLPSNTNHIVSVMMNILCTLFKTKPLCGASQTLPSFVHLCRCKMPENWKAVGLTYTQM